MFPVIKLETGHVKRAVVYGPEEYVIVVNEKLILGKTHGGGPITAPTTLMKYEVAVDFAKLVNDLGGFRTNGYSWHDRIIWATQRRCSEYGKNDGRIEGLNLALHSFNPSFLRSFPLHLRFAPTQRKAGYPERHRPIVEKLKMITSSSRGTGDPN
jgi:hypothetical protein